MSKCIDCKHWNTNVDDIRRFISDTGYGICNAAVDISREYVEHPIKLDHAIVTDYEGYAAELITGEDFGCSKWELNPDV